MQKIGAWLKKYFIPHAGNNHRPHFLRHESVMLAFTVVVLIELAFLAQVFVVFDKTKFLAAVLPGVLTNLTNEERGEIGAAPLTQNELLTRAAELKAQDMAEKSYFAHTSPEGLTPWHWLDVVGYEYSRAGENLAVNFSESTDVSDAWMNSPTHRANIVRSDFTQIGIGVASGTYKGRNTTFVAQFFGTPTIVYAAAVPTSTPVTAPAPVPVPQPTPVPNPQPVPVPNPQPNPVPTPRPTPVAPTPTPTVVVTAPTAQPSATQQVLGQEIPQSGIRAFIQRALTSPMQSANYAYGVIALVFIGAVLLAVFIKYEVQHPAIILRGVAMVAVILLLFYVNIMVAHQEPSVPMDDLTANVIFAQ